MLVNLSGLTVLKGFLAFTAWFRAHMLPVKYFVLKVFSHRMYQIIAILAEFRFWVQEGKNGPQKLEKS
jgi:hypothetical protein